MRAKFFLIVFLFPVAVIAAGFGDDVCVSGILYDENESLAIVNDTLTKENDIVGEVKISKIKGSYVEFIYNGKTFSKDLGQGCKVIKPKKSEKGEKKLSKIFQADEEGFFSNYGKQLYYQAHKNFIEANKAFNNANITQAYIYYAKATKYAQGAMGLVTAQRHGEMVNIVYASRKQNVKLNKEREKIESLEYANLKSPQAIAGWMRNNINYEKDSIVHSKDDYWQTPKETVVLKSGDCEDFAFLAQALLGNIGIESSVIGVVYNKQDDLKEVKSHAMCVFPQNSPKNFFDNHYLGVTNANDEKGIVQAWCNSFDPPLNWLEMFTLDREANRIKRLIKKR
jgi:predicted transglutaminase-like cysteine proteinase